MGINSNDLGGIPRKTMVLFLLIDTSGSMQGIRIGQVNAAIEEMIPVIEEISEENSDAEIKIAILTFSSGCEWVTRDVYGNPGPQELESFLWNDLTAGGLTELGAACRELDKKLSKKEFLNSSTGNYAPAIILLSDGEPNDDWERGLSQLKQNRWFKVATKIAIGVDEMDTTALKEFTGSEETVVEVNSKDGNTLKKLLSRLATVSSSIQSHSKPITNESGDDEEAAFNTALEIIQTCEESLDNENVNNSLEEKNNNTQVINDIFDFGNWE